MRFVSVKLAFLAMILVSACDFWPEELHSFTEAISIQVSGETTAWLLGGDAVVIDVAGSPLYQATQTELEAVATEIAEQANEFVEAPLESIVITFHESEVSDDQEKMRDFIFLVMEGRPVLQPYLDFDATGPLNLDEIEAAMGRLGEGLAKDQRECVRRESEMRARDAGNPETLDPANVEFLTAETWDVLDAFGKRLILTQAIITEALFLCAQRRSG